MRACSRYFSLWVGLLLCGLPANSLAQWAPGGIPVPGADGNNPHVVVDGQGGVFVGWPDGRAYPTNLEDVYAQHLTGFGTLAAGCPPTGIPVCTTPLAQYFNAMASDGLGGAFLGWADARNPGIGYTPCAQRITPAGGIAAGWPTDGISVAAVGSSDGGPQIAPDGSGGAFFVWEDIRNGLRDDLYMQHLTATGSVAPGWSSTGLPLAAYPEPQQVVVPILSDGSGGMFVCWLDGRPGAVGQYMQHVLGDGSLAPGWPDGGLRVSPRGGLIGIAPDGSGGFYIGLAVSSLVYQNDSTYYLLRVTATGQAAPGWPAAGTLVCNADFVRGGARISADAAGHVFMAWDDYRGHGYSHIYATEMLPDGTFAPGWPVNGAAVSTYPGYQFTGDVLADGTGGVFIAGQYDGSGNSYGFMQHFTGNGAPAPGWNAAGVQLNPQPEQFDPRLAPDGLGGAIVVWENRWVSSIYAQRFLGDGVTATLLSLVSADAHSDHVALLWQGSAAQSVTAAVERRTASSGWQRLGTAVLEGTDRLRYDDREVAAGTRYAYRLSYTLEGAPGTTAETWVDVPATAQLALAGLRPNPSSGVNLRVSFSLANAGPARLELIDIAGRRIAAREVGSLGPGEHVAPLQPDARMPAGLYWLRLTQGNRSLVTRAVVTG